MTAIAKSAKTHSAAKKCCGLEEEHAICQNHISLGLKMAYHHTVCLVKQISLLLFEFLRFLWVLAIFQQPVL